MATRKKHILDWAYDQLQYLEPERFDDDAHQKTWNRRMKALKKFIDSTPTQREFQIRCSDDQGFERVDNETDEQTARKLFRAHVRTAHRVTGSVPHREVSFTLLHPLHIELIEVLSQIEVKGRQS